ncbi:MAG: BrnT family toxin [Alcanivoracaceae bacterium]|nr:BrnT family toxin [Alcanivoracaceae bacterium]
MNGLKFEWDENKNISNQKKHSVSFEEAKTVFFDELARLIPDPDHSIGEQRYILMGKQTVQVFR